MLKKLILITSLPFLMLSPPTSACDIVVHDYENQHVVDQYFTNPLDWSSKTLFNEIDELLKRHPSDPEYQSIAKLHREWKLKYRYNDWMAGDLEATPEFLEAARLHLIRLGEWLYVRPTSGEFKWRSIAGEGTLHLLVDHELAQFRIQTLCYTAGGAGHSCSLGGHIRIKEGWMQAERLVVLSTKYGLIIQPEDPPELPVRGAVLAVDWCGMGAELDGFYGQINKDVDAATEAIQKSLSFDDKLVTKQSSEWKTLMKDGLDGNPDAANQLWSFYVGNQELSTEPQAYWMYRAATVKNPAAMYRIGKLLTTYNEKLAKNWFQCAADEGYVMANEALRELEANGNE